jgi:glucosamine-6-phosphate deaminase
MKTALCASTAEPHPTGNPAPGVPTRQTSHPLSKLAPGWWDYTTLDPELLADAARIDERKLRGLSRPGFTIHFYDTTSAYSRSYDAIRCVTMQGGQGEIKHWAFNDPPARAGRYRDAPPTPAEYRQLGTRVVELHPVTVIQNARTSGGGNVALVPTHAATVGPRETWKAEKVSIWHPGHHDNPFGIRLTALMISERIASTCVPMSLLADHPNAHFHYLRPGLGKVDVEMH